MRMKTLFLAALLLAGAGAGAVPAARDTLPLEIAAGGGHVGLRMEHSGALQMMLRHRIRESRVDAFWNVTGGGDEIYRYNDELRMPLGTFMPQRSTGRPAQRKVLNEQALSWADQYRTLPRYQVLFLSGAPFVKRYKDDDPNMKMPEPLFDRSAEMQQEVVDFVKAGGTLVLVGPTSNLAAPPYKTETGTATRVGAPLPLQALFASAAAPAPDTPILAEPAAGIPFEWFQAWPEQQRGKIAPLVPPGGSLLARRTADGKSVPVGAAWSLEKGRIFHFPAPVSSSTFLFARDRENGLDTLEACLRLWEQLAHLGTYGPRAFPVMADVPAILTPVPAGAPCAVRLRLLGDAPVRLQGELRAPGPDGAVEWSGSLDVPAGTNREAAMEIAVPAAARGGAHPVAVEVLSADGSVQYHQALSTLTVAPRLKAAVASDRPGYATGEPVRLTVTARNGSDRPVNATATVTVFDLDGRALWQSSRPLAIPPAPPPPPAPPAKGKSKEAPPPPPAGEAAVSFEWPLPPTALRAYTFWVRAGVNAGDGPAAAAGCRFYRSEKWDSRNQLVWGIKNYEGMRSREHLAPFMRTVEASGLNSVNWNIPVDALEARGWFGDLEWGKPWIRASQVKFVPEGDEPVLRAHFKAIAERELQNDSRAMSPAIAIVSIGEESGYGGGWGTIWEWWNRPASPEGSNAFHRYLSEKYPDIAALNASWNTAFGTFSEIPLEETYVAVPTEVDGQPVLTAPRQARYVDTRQFFMARARRWAALAQEEFRKVLPAPMTVYGYGNYLSQPADLKTEPSLLDPPDQPGFTMAWWPYSDLDYMRGTMWGFLAAHVAHQAGYNADQCINYDLGLSPLSVANRQFMAQLGPAAPLVLHGHPLKTTAVGQLTTWQPRLAPSSNGLLPAALREAGMPALTSLETNTAAGLKFLHVTDALRIAEPRARQVRNFVENGGTALIGVNFALEDEHGNLYASLPGLELETLTGVRQSAPAGRVRDGSVTNAFVITTASGPVPSGLAITAEGRDPKPVVLSGTTVLAAYPDGTPALTVRPSGKGTVYWVNAVKPGGDYGKLLLAFAREAGLENLYERKAADGSPADDLFIVPYASDNGRVLTFVCLRRAGKQNRFTLTLNRPGYRFFDAAGGRPLPAEQAEGRTVVPFSLEPASGRILTAVPYEVEARIVSPSPVEAGKTFTVTLGLQARGRSIGRHVADLSATGPDGRPFLAFARTLSVTGETNVSLATALNDPPGSYTLTLTDLATGAKTSTLLNVKATPEPVRLPAFKLEWPSESFGFRRIGDARFLDELDRLARLYLTPGGDRLTHGFYQQGHGDTRYNLAQALAAVDWRVHADALRRAIGEGLTVVLVGEDMGFSPSLRFPTYPHAEGRQLEVLDRITAGIVPKEIRMRPSLRLYAIGKGRLILDRQSWDESVWTLPGTAAFREQWLGDVKTLQAEGKSAAETPVSQWFFEGTVPVARAGDPAGRNAGRQAENADADPDAPWAPAKADHP